MADPAADCCKAPTTTTATTAATPTTTTASPATAAPPSTAAPVIGLTDQPHLIPVPSLQNKICSNLANVEGVRGDKEKDQCESEKYPTHPFKKWTIYVQPTKTIQLKFDDNFNIPSSGGTSRSANCNPSLENQCGCNWVTIVDETKNRVILDKTCNINKPSPINSKLVPEGVYTNHISIYYNIEDSTVEKGFSLFKETERAPDFDKSEECLWDCEWVDNPAYKTFSKYVLPNDDTTQVLILFTTPKIPKSLSCLADCFSGEDIAKLSTDCSKADIIGTQNNDVSIDCLLFTKKKEPSIRRQYQGNNIGDHGFSADDRNRRKREAAKVRPHPIDDDNIGLMRSLDYIIPNSPSDLALEFCILAKQYKSSGIVFNGEDCSEIFPQIFKNDQINRNRVFGATSSSVKR